MSRERLQEIQIQVSENVHQKKLIPVDLTTKNIGSIPRAIRAYVTVVESGDALIHQTILTVTDLPQAVINGTEYQSSQIYDLPEGRLLIQGTTASLAQTTTSALAGTLNASSTGAISLGTVAASNVALTSTMVDLLPTTAFTSSATVDVEGTAVTAALAASTQLDGTSTAKSVFLNTAYATTTDVDADATQTISGTITLTWINLGDY